MTLSIYAALLALLYVALSIRTIRVRRKLKVGIGDGDSQILARAIRVHSNFAEYVPIALILALLLELTYPHKLLIHFVCATLLLGRCIHAYGVSNPKENYTYRVTGMALSFTSICTSAIALLLKSSGVL